MFGFSFVFFCLFFIFFFFNDFFRFCVCFPLFFFGLFFHLLFVFVFSVVFVLFYLIIVLKVHCLYKTSFAGLLFVMKTTIGVVYNGHKHSNIINMTQFMGKMMVEKTSQTFEFNTIGGSSGFSFTNSSYTCSTMI